MKNADPGHTPSRHEKSIRRIPSSISAIAPSRETLKAGWKNHALQKRLLRLCSVKSKQPDANATQSITN
jgi:hypothetical protein